MRAAFIHDHVFLRFNGEYYSQGKLTYSKLSEYLKYCDHLTVIGRVKDVDYQPDNKFKANGDSITIHGFKNLTSFHGLLERGKIKNRLEKTISNMDFVISRLPSEYGIMAESICRSKNIPSILEVVASAFDCLWYRGDFLAKLYAPLIQYRTKKIVKNGKYAIYVTDNFLQNQYPCDGISVGVSDAVITSFAKDIRTSPNKNITRIGVIGNPALKLKGIETLIKSVQHLDNDNIQVSLVGGGLKSKIEKQLLSLNFVEQVGYISTSDELSDWFQTLDLYVQPSFTEGLPRSVIEAMSFSLPVIGTSVGGIPELVRSDMTFSKGNYKQLASLIETVLSTPGLYKELSEFSLLHSKGYDVRIHKIRNDFISNFIDNITE
jgi:glycosyltransferase involved in cell wall biosynthesis